MSEMKTNNITTTIQGQYLQVNLNGQCLFSLNKPLIFSYQLVLENNEHQHTLWMNAFQKGRVKLFVTHEKALAERLLNRTSEALGRLAIKEETFAAITLPSYRWKWMIPVLISLFIGSTWLAYSLLALRQTTVIQTTQEKDHQSDTVEIIPAPETRTIALPMPTITSDVTPSISRGTLSQEDAAEARRLLASRLKMGAEKKTFTISLSSGHSRSLYVFSDPACPNCQLFEPTVQALSAKYNVDIFPVTLIGKVNTAAQVVPLLCLPAEKRAEKWRHLFDIDTNLLNPGENSENTVDFCESGKNALARNDMAFELYRLPGTPTVISDDGRLIPLQAMTSDSALDIFLNHTP